MGAFGPFKKKKSAFRCFSIKSHSWVLEGAALPNAKDNLGMLPPNAIRTPQHCDNEEHPHGPPRRSLECRNGTGDTGEPTPSRP